MDVLKRLFCCRTRQRQYTLRVPTAKRVRCALRRNYAETSYRSCIKSSVRVFDDVDPSSSSERSASASPVPEEDRVLARAASPLGTRARFTYGLDRFEKNAMLILAQSEPQGRQFVDQRVEMLTRSFGAFRFEVDAHVDLDPEQMEARMEDFFRRDFSQVGAVCVAVVGGAGEAGQLPARTQHCDESRVLRHLTDQLPSALAGRPRIYITEIARSDAAAVSGAYSLPITSSFPDVIAVHIPVIIEGETNPLQMLCDRLGSERDFRAEVMSTVHAAETAFPALAACPVLVDSTLSLDLDLVGAESVPDVNGTLEVSDGAKGTLDRTVVANDTSERLCDSDNGTSVQSKQL